MRLFSRVRFDQTVSLEQHDRYDAAHYRNPILEAWNDRYSYNGTTKSMFERMVESTTYI